MLHFENKDTDLIKLRTIITDKENVEEDVYNRMGKAATSMEFYAVRSRKGKEISIFITVWCIV